MMDASTDNALNYETNKTKHKLPKKNIFASHKYTYRLQASDAVVKLKFCGLL